MSEAETVRRFQAGDTLALHELYAAYAESAVRTSFLITRNRVAAEDAVQEAFVQVLRSVATLRDPTLFRPWFYRILINAAKRQSRRGRRSLSMDMRTLDRVDLSAIAPEEAAIGIEEIQMVRTAVADLNDGHREIIVLRYYTCLSEVEIAQMLGVPLGTVKSRLHRARLAVQKRIASRLAPVSPGRASVSSDRMLEYRG